MYIGLVHKHSLKTGIRVAACQDLFIELEYLVQIRHGVFEQWQQLWQAEMGHLYGDKTKYNVSYQLGLSIFQKVLIMVPIQLGL